MRIARFTTGDEPAYGVITGDLDELGQPADDAVVVALAGDPLYVGVKLLDQEHRLADVRLLAPVLPRSKVVGIGRNYRAHAAELGNQVPDEPLFFIKPNTSVCGPGDPISYPHQTKDLHYEGELAVVIGRICRDVPATLADVSGVIWGYTIGNDVTARDLQRSDVQFTRSKASTRSARSVPGSRPTSTRSTSPTASPSRPTSTARSCRTAAPPTWSSTSPRWSPTSPA